MVRELHLTLLGGLRITEGGAPLPGFTPHKGQALLCYLALTGRPHSRDALASLLWSDDPQEEARASLRNVLFLLRKVAAPYFVATRETIAFNLECPHLIDVQTFRDKVAATNASPSKGGPGVVAKLREAMEIYGGEFLDGFYVPGAALFEEWVLTERELLHGMAIEVLQRLALECVRQGDTQAAISYLNRLLVLEPWREEARRDLMRLLAETGQRSAALSEYEICRRVLLAELGVEPGEETTALYGQILAGEIGPGPTEARQTAIREPKSSIPKPPTNLPAALTTLFGRDMELSRLADRLQRPDLRLLTLVGEGGIGKTRLATELADRVLPDFPDGVYFVALSAVQDSGLVPSAIAQALKVQEGQGRTYLDALKEWLAERKVLLVLDNFEQLLDATGTVIELLQTAPGLKMLVTSREPLATIGEHVFPVPPLPVPDLLHTPALESLDQFSSIALFCARAEAVRFGFLLTAENAPSVTGICRRLDGSPLAIELAAARAGEFEVGEIAQRLNDRFRLLTKGNRAASERHQTLKACIGWSYDLLNEQDRRLFRRLSVFAGGWSMEAAGAVCGGTTEDIPEGTRRLVDKSLVVREGETGRYGMHESIRQYAAAKLEEADEAESTHASHLRYFTELAEASEQRLTGPDAVEWLDKLDLEHDNLRADFDWLQNQTEPAGENAVVEMRLAGALWRFWLMRGYLEEGGRRLEAALAANGAAEMHLSDPSARPLLGVWSRALTGAGAMAETRGDYARSLSYMERNLAVRRAMGDMQGIAHALHNLGQANVGAGNLVRARQLIEESLAIKRELGDKNGITRSLGTLGTIAYYQMDYTAACPYFEESIALSREIGNFTTLGNILGNFGVVLLEMGELDRARTLLEESLALAQESGNRPATGRALGGLGQLAAERGDYALALSLQKDSLEQFQQAGDLHEIAENLADVALAVGALGHPEEASRLMGAAEAARLATHYQLMPPEIARIERGLSRMRSETKIDPRRLEAAHSEGLNMTLEQAIAAALAAPRPGQPS